MQNPFDEFIPAQPPQAAASNPFDELVPRDTQSAGAPQEMGLWEGLGRHLLANTGSALQNTDKNIALPILENTPYFGNVIKSAENIPQISQGKDKAFNADLYKSQGINKGILDDISQGTMEFLPYMFGAGSATKAISEIPAAAKFFSKFASNNPIAARIGGEAAKNVIANDVMALNQSDKNDAGQNLLYGTATGIGSPLIGYPLAAAGRYVGKQIAQSAIPGLTKRATDYMRNLLDPNDYAGQLYNKFTSMFDKNKAAWNSANQAASNIDESLQGNSQASPNFQKSGASSVKYREVPDQPTMVGKDYSRLPADRQMIGNDPYTGAPIFKNPDEYSSPVTIDNATGKVVTNKSPSSYVATGSNDPYTGAPILENKINFNNSPYHDYIDNFINKVQNMEPAQRQEYTQALTLANKAKELAPQSLGGTIAARKNINQDLKDFLNQQGSNTANNAMNSQSRQFLTGLKNTLKNDIPNANAGNISEEAMNDFTDKWQAANKAHQDLQEFYKSPQAGTGVVKPVRQTREAFQSGQPLDAAVIGKYMPRPNQTGTQGLDQLAKMYGSKEQAQDAVKAYMNRKVLENGNTTLDATGEYGKLSPAQRDWIYGGSKEGDLLKAANDTRKAFSKEPEKSLYGIPYSILAHYIAAPIIGGGAGYYAGGAEGALAGATLPVAGSMMMKKFAGKLSPQTIQGLIRYAQSRPVNPGRYMNIASQALNYGGTNQ
jgi:hypothetical protein